MTGGLLMSRVADEWSSYEYPIDIRGARIHSVTPDGQYIWIGSDAGVARVDTAMFERAPDGR